MKPLLFLAVLIELLCVAITTAQPLGAPLPTYSAKMSEDTNCGTVSQHGGASDLFDSTSYGQAVRWEGLWQCTITIGLVFYQPASSTPNYGGIFGCVWLDDGLGRPGSLLFSKFIPHDSIVYYPGMTEVHFPSCSEYFLHYGIVHTGFVPAVSGDIYAGLVDDADNGSASTSSILIQGNWNDIGAAFGGHGPNWVQEIELCCYSGCGYVMSTWDDCNDYDRHSPSANARAMKYAMPELGPCNAQGPVSGFWLESVEIMLDSSASAGQVGIGGIDVKVWSDSKGLPGIELASVHVPHEQCKFSPQLLTVSFAANCDLQFRRLTSIHVGFEATVSDSDFYPVVSDDGTHNGKIGSERISGTWIHNQELYSPLAPNWRIAANIGAMKCGNANAVNDFAGMINISDVVYLVNYIFGGVTPLCHWYHLDANCSGFLSISDAVYLINYIFGGGPAPCSSCS